MMVGCGPSVQKPSNHGNSGGSRPGCYQRLNDFVGGSLSGFFFGEFVGRP